MLVYCRYRNRRVTFLAQDVRQRGAFEISIPIQRPGPSISLGTKEVAGLTVEK